MSRQIHTSGLVVSMMLFGRPFFDWFSPTHVHKLLCTNRTGVYTFVRPKFLRLAHTASYKRHTKNGQSFKKYEIFLRNEQSAEMKMSVFETTSDLEHSIWDPKIKTHHPNGLELLESN